MGRPGLRSNTRTSFTANGDRVEEYIGDGSLRIGTHWVDDEEGAAAATAVAPMGGLGVRGGRRGSSGYGRDAFQY